MYRKFEETINADYPNLPDELPTADVLEALSELPEAKWRYILDKIVQLGLNQEDKDAGSV